MQGIAVPYHRLQSVFKHSNGQTSNGERKIWALKDVSFEVKHGEVLGVIGRNGAGKSTLLKILSRITEPTEGHADICGRVGSLLEVGTGFHPELTGGENIYLNGAILGMTRREIARRFDEIVAFAEVDNFLGTPVKHYSSGMYMRLAFAVAAHLHPEILLVDEVLAVGDAAFQKKCLGQMNRISQQGRTVIFVSHNMGAINDLCPTCLLLENGKVLTSGRTDRVISFYLAQPGLRGESVRFDCRSSDASFVSLVLKNQRGKPATVFALQEAVTVTLRLLLRKQIRGLQASIALFNYRGDRIFYHSSAYCDPPLFIEQPGTYEVKVELPPKLLLPGPYCLNIALHIPNVQLFDLREHVAPFEIEDTGSGRYDYPPHACACVFVELNWKARKVPEQS
jgi:lipopolysaccharide transport system ATP-binding protein